MINRLDNIGVAVTDVQRTVDFFREILGLPGEVSDYGGTVNIGNASLYIFQGQGLTANAARTTDLENNPIGIDHLSFEVDDIEQAGAELEAKGVIFPGPIAGEAGEFRYRGFSDPDGNMLYIVQQA
jgi:catechol 2,3-dioxygenase-like lactoylglutathione lyase family enzyme